MFPSSPLQSRLAQAKGGGQPLSCSAYTAVPLPGWALVRWPHHCGHPCALQCASTAWTQKMSLTTASQIFPSINLLLCNPRFCAGEVGNSCDDGDGRQAMTWEDEVGKQLVVPSLLTGDPDSLPHDNKLARKSPRQSPYQEGFLQLVNKSST